MKKKYVSMILWAFIVWVVPLFISFWMYEPVSGQYLPNIYVFKITMFLIYALMVWIAVSLLYRKYADISWMEITLIFFIIDALLDLIVLVLGLNISILEWLTIIATYAVVSFFISYQIALSTGRIKR